MTTLRIGCEFSFDAGHFIPGHPGPCRQTHGHTYRLEVVVEGPVQENGMVMDFQTVKDVVRREVLSALDHHLLNDVMENPTVEACIEWIWARLQPHLPLASVKLWEGEGKWAEKTASSG
jgi:6-pyruvoyltetrahydropterin/6-carboxytetrahydropterin synthase